MQLHISSTSSAATLLIPLIMGAIFAVIWVQNDAIPDVSQSFSRDLKQLDALQLQVDCTTRDSQGNANPFCPGAGVSRSAIPPPVRLQFFELISAFCDHSNALPFSSVEHRRGFSSSPQFLTRSVRTASCERRIGHFLRHGWVIRIPLIRTRRPRLLRSRLR